eukprot:4161847-Amphidinium_carterae.1
MPPGRDLEGDCLRRGLAGGRDHRQRHTNDLRNLVQRLHRWSNDIPSLNVRPGTGGLAPILRQQSVPLTCREFFVSPDLADPVQRIPGRSAVHVHGCSQPKCCGLSHPSEEPRSLASASEGGGLGVGRVNVRCTRQRVLVNLGRD